MNYIVFQFYDVVTKYMYLRYEYGQYIPHNNMSQVSISSLYYYSAYAVFHYSNLKVSRKFFESSIIV